MPEAHKTGLYRAYALAADLVAPFAYRKVAQKLAQAKVPEKRIRERLGHTSQLRPDGDLIWFHAASVGESLSVLSLIETLGRLRREMSFLITSGTPTSARLIEQRMPPRCRHQFAPLDATAPLTRFLRHWHPTAAVVVESELWPQTLVRTYEADVPLALVNARLSEKSLQGWSRRPRTAKALLDVFSVILTQNAQMADALIAIGTNPDRVAPGANLKATSAPLPVDQDLVADMTRDLRGRPVWVAASTHPGEEQLVLAAHQELIKSNPNLCLILAPRHPERGSQVETLVVAQGLSVARRSNGALPGDAQVYLADTLGELGSWYALAPFVFLGGSLLPIGGHNPYEVVQAGIPVLTGPHVTNFAETFEDLGSFGGSRTVTEASELARHAKIWLDDPKALNRAGDGARAFMAAQQQGLEHIAQKLLDALLVKGSMTPAPAARSDLKTTDVIAPNFKRRLSGVTATIVRLVPLQSRQIAIAATGPVLPELVPQVPLHQLPFMSRRGPDGSGYRIWHARRNVEMIGGLALKYLLAKRLKLVFTSASQRKQSNLTRWLIRRMDAVVATSGKTAAYLENPAQVIMHGIDIDTFSPSVDRRVLRRKMGLPEKGVLIGCYGRIRAQKGTDAFVRAMLKVCRDHPNVTALVMGRATEKYQAFDADLRDQVAAAGMSEKILFKPEVPTEAMADWYRVLDLYIAPQRWEGFGLTPIEAMACACPVIATRVGAFEELIVEGQTGALVDPGDIDAMVSATNAALSDPVALAEWSSSARDHVVQKFSIEREASALVALYRKLLQSA